MKVQSIPKDAQEIHQKFLANNIREDLSRFINPDIFIRFTRNSLEVFTNDGEDMWKYTYQL